LGGGALKAGIDMSTKWRVSSFNGALLAAYFYSGLDHRRLQDHDFADPRSL